MKKPILFCCVCRDLFLNEFTVPESVTLIQVLMVYATIVLRPFKGEERPS